MEGRVDAWWRGLGSVQELKPKINKLGNTGILGVKAEEKKLEKNDKEEEKEEKEEEEEEEHNRNIEEEQTAANLLVFTRLLEINFTI